ncbi:DEAD/DEAH box helicase family protein [Microbacterium sp. GXF6406]
MSTKPLVRWHFSGTLRTYQAEALSRLPISSDTPLHIVAPPGSGKTLLGLLLAAREGHRTLVLSPTVVIREQWADTARALAGDDDAVADDPSRQADLTALTYQMLSVTGDGSPFEDLARAIWVEELAADRSESSAATALAELAVDNPKEYRAGIRRRVRGLRSRFTKERPDLIARVLHPRAVARIDELVEHGIRTVILDECHHLLDHWALVVAYLVARLRERGLDPLVIGLTATLPSPDDRTEYDNYTQLLGDVDYEVPTPAVVKEGHLAPYRDHVTFTEPTDAELLFLRRHETLLDELLLRVLSTPEGLRYLHDRVQPPGTEGEEPSIRFERALAEDFALARTCAAALLELAPEHPLAGVVPDALRHRCTSDDLLIALSRFAQDRLLPDPAARNEWEYVRRSLADFGYRLTDTGIRRGRNAVESTLAHSAAKDHTAVRILREEVLSADGDRLRAVVVTDFVEHGNHNGEWGPAAAGAERVFRMLAADEITASLSPVLLTGQILRTRSVDAARIATALEEALGAAVSATAAPDGTAELNVAGASVRGGAVVRAVSDLIGRGEVRALVSTRGLLGEGWDCPAVNTLIDLTTVTTAASTQQLRGRTLRLDPSWPGKVAHNWSVCCVLPPEVELADTAEVTRLRRRHAHLWGVSVDDPPEIVTGLGHALPGSAQDAVDAVVAKDPASTVDAVNALAAAARPTRAQTRTAWRVGSPFAFREREVVLARRAPRSAPVLRTAPAASADALGGFAVTAAGAAAAQGVFMTQGALIDPAVFAGVVLGAGAVTAASVGILTLGRALRDRRHPGDFYRRAAIALARALHDSGRTGAFVEDEIVVHADAPGAVRIEVGGSGPDRRMLADALEELFGPVVTPRFLLRVDRSGRGSRSPFADLADRLSPGRTLLAVPRIIGRRRGDAERLHAHWRDAVGPCSLHELDGTRGLALLTAAHAADGWRPAASRRTSSWS